VGLYSNQGPPNDSTVTFYLKVIYFTSPPFCIEARLIQNIRAICVLKRGNLPDNARVDIQQLHTETTLSML
jgi:hypothetical protein